MSSDKNVQVVKDFLAAIGSGDKQRVLALVAEDIEWIIATIGNGSAFRKGRDFAAWLGVVPEEHSTGGKQTLWKIPRRGNQYLRRLFVQGARAVMQHRTKQSSGLSAWLAQLTARTHQNIAIVALANKLARMAWAVPAKNEVYRPPLLAGNTI
jgi:transposase